MRIIREADGGRYTHKQKYVGVMRQLQYAFAIRDMPVNDWRFDYMDFSKVLLAPNTRKLLHAYGVTPWENRDRMEDADFGDNDIYSYKQFSNAPQLIQDRMRLSNV